MPLPPKEMYTIAEIAGRWEVPVETIEDYLLTGKLAASFFLTEKMVGKYTRVFCPEKAMSDDDPYIYDIDLDDPDCYPYKSGVFDLCYQSLTWDEQGKSTLSEGYNLGLTLPDGEDGYYGLVDPLILKRDDVFIVLSELERFEAEHGIDSDLKAKTPEKITSSSAVIGEKLHPKERETLLKIVIAMAIGGYAYNPAAKKSSTPADIKEDVEKLGLTIDDDTVRKWLQKAADYLRNETGTTEKPNSA